MIRSFTGGRDHPRACGENQVRFPLRLSSSGSPPRMRGKHRECRGKPGGCGITPAHAGKTSPKTPDGRLERDHPRACGENAALLLCLSLIPGSPPRMRGKPGVNGVRVVSGGITPAHAGKTVAWEKARKGDANHPRVCGENPPILTPFRRPVGSPPACAGKTRGSGTRHNGSSDHPRVCGENI